MERAFSWMEGAFWWKEHFNGGGVLVEGALAGLGVVGRAFKVQKYTLEIQK